MINNKFKKVITGSLGLLTLLTGFMINVGVTLATSILDNPDVSVPKPGETVDGKYSTIAKFTKGVTKAVPLSDSSVKWYDVTTADNVYGDEHTVELSKVPKSQKGKIGEEYQNVGLLNGKPIDLVISVTDWVLNTEGSSSDSRLSFGSDNISMNSRAKAIQTKWTYVDHKTQKVLNGVNGFYTFNDLDANQQIGFLGDFSKHIKHIYVPTDKSTISYKKDDKGSLFSAGKDGTDPDDLTSMFTLLYDGAKDMDLFWSGISGKDSFEKLSTNSTLDFNKKATDIEKKSGSGFAVSGDWIGYMAKKPLATATIKPSKTVSDSNENNVENNTLSNINEPFSYTISHQVPDEYADFYYKDYKMTDKIADVLKVNKLSVKDDSGKDVTKKFTNNSKDSTIELNAKPEELKKAEFYNHTYSFKIDVQVKDGADLSEYIQKDGSVKFDNVASVSKDGDSQNSNDVHTNDPKIDGKLMKSIEQDGKNVDSSDIESGKDYTYDIDGIVHQFDSKNHPVKTFAITDDLEDALNLKDVKVFDYTNKDKPVDITNKGKLELDTKASKFTWTATDVNSLIGHNLKTKVTASIKEDADLSKYTNDQGAITIPNTAQYIYNGVPENSTTPKVTPVLPKKVLPKTGVNDDSSKTLIITLVILAISVFGTVWYLKTNKEDK